MWESLKKYFQNEYLKTYLRQQFIGFKLLVAGVILTALIQIGIKLSTNQVPFSELPEEVIPLVHLYLPYITNIYIPLVLAFFSLQLCHFLFKNSKTITLFIYYNFWINTIYNWASQYDTTKKGFQNYLAGRILYQWFNPEDRANLPVKLILESFPNRIIRRLSYDERKDYPTFVQLISLGNRPVVVRREDLLEKNFLKKWAYVSVLLFKPIRITTIFRENHYIICLIIDLRNESYGIYNNGGKLFLKSYYLSDPTSVPRLIEKSQNLESFIKSDKAGEREFMFDIPFRWASGGIMPVAHYREKDWFVLFLRELDPVGLNIANGASENKAEYKDLYHLMFREFGEEVILLDRKPTLNSNIPINQKIFQFPYDQHGKEDRYIRNDIFAVEHQQMRRNHDGIEITFRDGPIIERIKTPFEVKITYHYDNLKEKSSTIENVIFNVNPTEFGIEVCYVAKFEMENDDYILDGEIWNDEFLVRQPVMLLSCSYIKTQYQKNQKIGTPCHSDDCKDCKDCRILDNIPADEYVLFDVDRNFRKVRLEKLLANGEGESIEAQKIRRWLDRHEIMFANIHESKIDLTSKDHRYLTRLCPVTWKTFEKLCQHNLL